MNDSAPQWLQALWFIILCLMIALGKNDQREDILSEIKSLRAAVEQYHAPSVGVSVQVPEKERNEHE